MFSTDFIFRQQKILLTTRNDRLDSGHYATKYYFHVGRLTIGREKEREAVRQCFLFSNHLIITSRTQGGKLHLVDNVGKIPLADITLLEDPNEEERTEDQGTLFDY